MRSCASPFVTRKRTDSGSSAPSTGASTSGATPPPTSRTRQPKPGSTRAAIRPAMADPSVKPQNISVTSDDRRAVGQNSDASVIVIGIAPPRPSPVRKRNAISDVRPPLYDDARLAAPNTIIDATSIVLRPWRSASGPTAKAPSISPKSPAANSGPSCATPSRHSARIAGAMNPMIAVSKPSMAMTRKQRNEQPLLQRRDRLRVDERLDVDDRAASGPSVAVAEPSLTSSSPASAIFASSRTSVFASAAVSGCEQPLLHAANARLDLLQDLLAGG